MKSATPTLCRTAALLAAALMMTACEDKVPAAPPSAPPAVEVGIVTVHPQKVIFKKELPGRASGYRVAEVRPQVSGVIIKRLFQEGSDVKAGQQLYQINPESYQAAYETAKAEVAKAEAGLKLARLKAGRYTELVKTNAVSRQVYDESVAAVEQGEAQMTAAKASVNAALINLNYTKVFAPISGRISKSLSTEGALVTANQTAPPDDDHPARPHLRRRHPVECRADEAPPGHRRGQAQRGRCHAGTSDPAS